jgi:TRAP transporter 4TM/12TM fusion protein
MDNDSKFKTIEQGDDSRYGVLPNYLKIIFLTLTLFGVILSVFFIFSIRVRGLVINEITYYYLFLAAFMPGSFLILPARPGVKKIQWYDLLLAALGFGIAIYLAFHEYEIRQLGWSRPPNAYILGLAAIYALLLLEISRRLAGWAFVGVSVVVGLYPLIAEYMPGLFYGKSFTLSRILGRNIYGYDGLIGLPCQVVAQLLLGFLIFAALLIASGAGNFFLNLSLSILGKYRGGPAKVAVLASAFFGSLSGNPMANIVGTGSVTIPTMKRTGFSAKYAAAIEACASSGGIIMPPVMGALAFVMAGFLGVDYAVIMVIAIVPSFLYFFGLLIQVDSYAARYQLHGLSQDETPPFWDTLKKGWPFIIILAFLVWGLVYMKWALYTPYYASVLMIIISFANKDTRFTPKKMVDAVATIGKLVCQTCAAILPMTFVLVGVVSTGISGAFTSTLIHATGGNVFLILLVGVFASYILGMAGLVVPAYLFLALSMAPAAIKAGDLNVLAVHMFIIYYALIGGITPPVAPGAFVAATLSGSKPMSTAFTAARLGIVLYFIPFFFVFNPALIFQGPIIESIYLIAFCVVGITLIAASLQGHLLFVRDLPLWSRFLICPAGFLIAFPEWKSSLAGAVLAVLTIMAVYAARKKKVAVA